MPSYKLVMFMLSLTRLPVRKQTVVLFSQYLVFTDAFTVFGAGCGLQKVSNVSQNPELFLDELLLNQNTSSRLQKRAVTISKPNK